MKLIVARVIKKKYKDVKIKISSLLTRDKANSQKRSLVIATNIYLKEAFNVNSFSFVELDSGWIVGSSLITLLLKNDHLHLTKFSYEKLSLLFLVSSTPFCEKLMKLNKNDNFLTAANQPYPSS